MDGNLFVLLLLSGLFWSRSVISRQYYYINTRMSWPEAQSYCRSKYTDLATVDNMGQVNGLISIVDAGYSGPVWIGLKRGTEKRWGWSNGENTTSEYYNWDLVEPDEDGDCVATCSGAWKDLQCSHLQYFPCYRDTGQQVYQPRVQDLVTVLACQEPILADGLNTAVIYGVLLSAMEVSI
ncbi:hypothetical protein QQF64_015543 [Cirrhinus molitorella]|uniref:C-type lectin domain-containing protein n=1 Tax=Cirrhinus molitorella TaxID=172907 RepID=A0ABR3NW89_9TELE